MKLTKLLLEAVNRGIQLALDDYQDIEPNSSISHTNDIIDVEDVIKNRIELVELDKIAIDLGLPSKTLWCKYNLGVDPNKLSKPKNWYGDYYAWGEIIPNKPKYNWKTYQFFNKKLFKYNKEDNLTELQFIDDPTYQTMHLYNFKFKMPTKADFDELIAETNKEWTSINGVNGYKFTNKSDSSKYIFLPAAGYCYGSDLRYIGEIGNYWSSNLDTDCPNSAWGLYFNGVENSMDNYYRCNGFSVRPVINLK